MPRAAELCVGIGFSSGARAPDIVDAVRAATVRLGRVLTLATVSVKADSPMLRAAALALDAPVVSFSPDVLAAVQVPSPSARVAGEVGTASVAEAAAILASGGGALLVGKTSRNSVTVAVARKAETRKVSPALEIFDDETECE
ncbi:cobalt-precorrin 5A hydrolase [Rhodococcus sp. 27YEA15]|uniref:cobalamin biosynthesis protein n=1 Tax=Rhodococcus sp. 27YEA15 TaxID=3156259 RepID=UPI003C797A81